ncbi:hypothetical protein CFP56_013728 [Quercus suber]|uniref:Glycosyl transferase CAP10 domain-containing protein n=1 Tax=Quercus suber TaxID=58331 RepID=A0AAW0KUN3_QUESU|nr:hypothetical protein CFP56_45904 [Quercus suber]
MPRIFPVDPSGPRALGSDWNLQGPFGGGPDIRGFPGRDRWWKAVRGFVLRVCKAEPCLLYGLLQLLKRYPGMVPDVDIMFDCMDKPRIHQAEHESMPLPLFRYCTTGEDYDIRFPDWSFWGW